MSQETKSDHDQEITEWQSLVEGGNDAYANKRYNEAELKFVAALRIAEKLSSAQELEKLDQHQQRDARTRLAKSLNNMAALYHTQSKYKMAEDLYNRCLDLKISLYGEEHVEVAINLHNLAAVHCAKRRWAMAEPLFKRAMEIRETALGPDHCDLVPILNNYALMLRRTNRTEEADQMEARANGISGDAAAPGSS
jgi:tetratricopeptide (TPR) repeat protein